MPEGSVTLLLIDLFFLTVTQVLKTKYRLWRKGFVNLLPWFLPASFLLLRLAYVHAILTLRADCLSPLCAEKSALLRGLQQRRAKLSELYLDLSAVKDSAEFSVSLQGFLCKLHNFNYAYDELRDLL